MNFLYDTIIGRFFLVFLLSSKALNLFARILYSPISKLFIKSYVRKHKIDMFPFYGQKYKSFADFFSRKKPKGYYSISPGTLISPCDGMLSVVPIDSNTSFLVKNINYSLNELLPDKEIAEKYKDGICLILRLRAEDYHHFCFIDDCYHGKSHFIEGKLHSVQPIALEKKPVFRINRRVWSIMDTKNFGQVVQMEVGAVLVGGIVLEAEEKDVKRGDEMGHFELCGSTIILLFRKEIRERLSFLKDIKPYVDSGEECMVNMGHAIGYLENIRS